MRSGNKARRAPLRIARNSTDRSIVVTTIAGLVLVRPTGEKVAIVGSSFGLLSILAGINLLDDQDNAVASALSRQQIIPLTFLGYLIATALIDHMVFRFSRLEPWDWNSELGQETVRSWRTHPILPISESLRI